MVSLSSLITRYPAMAALPPDRFAMLLEESVAIMGPDDGRWINVYPFAQAALIAHNAVISNALLGDEENASMASGPVTRTDVDDVQVEFAEKIWNSLPYLEADLFSTSYGQAYVRWRRMAFAGPRVGYNGPGGR